MSSLVACVSGTGSQSSPAAVMAPTPAVELEPGIRAFAWDIGLCGGEPWECATRVDIEGDRLSVRVGSDVGQLEPRRLSEEGQRGLRHLGVVIVRDNPPLHSGGCGAACDGLTFTTWVAASSDERFGTIVVPFMWGYGRNDEPMVRVFERLHALIAAVVRCTPDPWLVPDDGCVPIQPSP